MATSTLDVPDRAAGPSGTQQQMLKELKLNLEATVDRSTLENQMNKSKVCFVPGHFLCVCDEGLTEVSFCPVHRTGLSTCGSECAAVSLTRWS